MAEQYRNWKGMLRVSWVILIVIGLLAPAVSASPVQKLARGIYNVAFGWSEVIYRPIAEPEDHPEMQRLLEGTARGVMAAIGRTTVGAVEVLTFPVESPWDGKSVMYPEYLDFKRSAAKNLAL